MPRHATTAESSKKRYKIWEISLSSSVCLPVVGSQSKPPPPPPPPGPTKHTPSPPVAFCTGAT